MQVLKHRRRVVDSHSHPRVEYILARYLELGSFTVGVDVLVSRLFKNPFRACSVRVPLIADLRHSSHHLSFLRPDSAESIVLPLDRCYI